MIAERFHKKNDGKRRGDIHPARLRMASRRGVTLVELLISMLILTIVCLAWLEIIGIQSARKEARRREAIERLAGMMDAFMDMNKAASSFKSYYSVDLTTNTILHLELKFSVSNTDWVRPIFADDVSPIGYQLSVVTRAKLPDAERFGDDWKGKLGECKWLVGRLYNRSNCSESDAGKSFFTLPVCLGL